MSGPLPNMSPRKSYRALFLSDFHLGARSSRPEQILEFLRQVDAETIYLVGDILDLWHVRQVHWGRAHDAVLAELDWLGRTGTRIVFLPGNHDAPLRAADAEPPFAHCEMRESVIHIGADGRRHLVLHGDQCDSRLMRLHAMTRMGSLVDAGLRRSDAFLRGLLGISTERRSPIDLVLRAANAMMTFGSRFEKRLTALATEENAQGVICGHSHKPALRSVDDIIYANCGDWVDNLTAIVENSDGRLQLIDASVELAARPAHKPVPVPSPVPAPAQSTAALVNPIARMKYSPTDKVRVAERQR